MYEEDQELCGLPAQNINWLNNLIDELKKEIKINSVILFGSRASEDHTVWSDYDICIVSNDFTKLNKWDRMDLVLSKWHGERALEPICYTSEELENCNYTLAYEIIDKGKIIYDDGTFRKILQHRKNKLKV